MHRNSWRTLLLVFIVVAPFAVCLLGARVYASPDAELAVEPNIMVKAPGESFNITLFVTNVADLFAWEFNMTFSPSVLEAVNYFEGPFLPTAGSTFPLTPSYNNTAGWVSSGGALFPYPAEGASGNGTLAYVTFRVKAEGKSVLHFYDTKLRSWDATAGELTQIVHTSVDGLFQYPLMRDLAVTSVISSLTSVSSGGSVSIDVTVTNKGNVPETFEVSLSYNSTLIETKPVTELAPDAVDTVNFVWNTQNVSPGNYVITATALAVSGETNTGDNSNSNLVLKVTAAPPVIPLELLIGVIVVVAVLGVGAFFFMRRRSSKK
jgi:hypothetical protein